MESTYTTALSDQVQSGAQDARDFVKDLSRDAAATRQNYADEAMKGGRQVLESAKTYAKDAVNATGQKVGEMKEKAGNLKDQSGQYIAEQPMRSVLIAAAGGAALTALFVAAMRRNH